MEHINDLTFETLSDKTSDEVRVGDLVMTVYHS